MADLDYLSVVELSSLIRDRKVSAREAAEAAIVRVEAVEPKIKAFLTVTAEEALCKADEVDSAISRGEKLGLFAGVPFALKDNMCTRGTRTTCGSRILPNFIPPYSATVVNRLDAAGAILIGKTNCDEFAMGSSTENSGYGPTGNPWEPSCVPGGSSGGSAAAVASGEVTVALGSDTGGSIRQPASMCGIVGLKPTYGRVSRYGLVAYASSLDQIGPLCRTVQDCALAMNAIAGHDELDSTSVSLAVPDFLAACNSDVKGLKIGVPREYFGEGVAPEVAYLVKAAIDKLCELGAIAEECSLPSTDLGLASYYIIAPAEASSNLARFDGVKYGHRTKELAGHIGLMEKTRDEGFGDEVKQRIMIGTYALSAGYYDAYYKRAQQVRTLIRREFDKAFEQYDVLLTPTAPTTAFKIGEKSNDPLAMKLADACTLPINLAGIPGMSIPCGFSNGLPVGLQILAKPFDEETIFRTAYTYEQATEWHRQRPSL
jgi:aspartyl-tRNA(Asn)/glutamyl-tRNA(Gln) amidotransferase subunit A